MHCFLPIIFLIFTFYNLSEAKYGKRLPSAVVVGTVYCDTCFKTDFPKTSPYISEALVAVECGVTNSKPSFRKEVRTDKHGEFKVLLPFSVSKHVKEIKGCSVKLISSGEPYCSVASTATSYSLHLKSRKKGVHIFSAGFFTFKPLNQPTLCSQQPSLLKSKEFNTKKSSAQVSVSTPSILPVPPQTQDPTPMPNLLPPLPELPSLPPLPQLPPLPPFPGFPNFPTNEAETSRKSKSTDPFRTSEVPLFPLPGFGFRFPPNPFLPQPPSLKIPPPNPLLRPPTSSIFPPPIPFQPSPPVSQVPQLVGLNPPPSQPAPVGLPSSSFQPPPALVGLPSFPFQPALGFPGVPLPPVTKKTSP